jgi:hypothetical protein
MCHGTVEEVAVIYRMAQLLGDMNEAGFMKESLEALRESPETPC